jgi:hypothetical protein
MPIDDKIFVAQPDITRICSFNISFGGGDNERLLDGESVLIFRNKI